jgi:acyl-coenzyme A thioesterase PaaI-like protein
VGQKEPRPFSDAYATLESLRQLADSWNGTGPMKRLGVRLDFERVDRVRAVIDPVEPYHRGGIGTAAVNGAVLAGLFDLAIGTVGWLSRPNTRSATVSLSMTFLRPTRGDRVVVEARLLRAGVNLTFAAAEITDGSGDVTARCDGTVAVARGGAEENEYTKRMRPAARPAPTGPEPSRPRGSLRRTPRSPRPSSRSRG